MSAYFRCKHCGQDHQSPLYFPDEKSFATDELGAISLSCPVTQKTAAYEKRDMFWLREETRRQEQLRQS